MRVIDPFSESLHNTIMSAGYGNSLIVYYYLQRFRSIWYKYIFYNVFKMHALYEYQIFSPLNENPAVNYATLNYPIITILEAIAIELEAAIFDNKYKVGEGSMLVELVVLLLKMEINRLRRSSTNTNIIEILGIGRIENCRSVIIDLHNKQFQ
ncbi:unnamed protein product [Brugia timori]|uniref:Uncharacterized protein n=1 Tax=Brugia timori TaxID=42155 RepID=A0A0R3Q907_9BILA|nr:unnamed protein product [Brugia timori]